ncbi:GntR family transcriptional regulator [Enterococcus sp. LJL128]|uniref:GntR family transcriptional regulator n=1 Tax=Enterococcus sp. LJL51 TaxID=3416656 RepID=UPI003CF3DA26
MKKKEFIVQDLLSKIYQDHFESGKLPNQRTLAATYQVSRFTIQEAIKNLQEIGVVYTVQGSGIYIQERLKKNPLIFNSLTRTPYDRISSKLLSLEKRLSTSEEEQIFQLEETQEIWVFERARIVDYSFEQIELSKMPAALFPDLSRKHVEHSIQEYVEKKGFRISHYITSYTPTTISRNQSELLLCKKGTPAMLIQNRCLLEDGRVFEYSEITAIDYTCTYIRPFDREIHEARNS